MLHQPWEGVPSVVGTSALGIRSPWASCLTDAAKEAEIFQPHGLPLSCALRGAGQRSRRLHRTVPVGLGLNCQSRTGRRSNHSRRRNHPGVRSNPHGGEALWPLFEVHLTSVCVCVCVHLQDGMVKRKRGMGAWHSPRGTNTMTRVDLLFFWEVLSFLQGLLTEGCLRSQKVECSQWHPAA